jgi:2-phospho-L-lactate guanylyltransferase
VLVLPADHACIAAPARRRFAAQARGRRAAVIAPDRAGDGTNALLLPARPRFAFAYGPGSFARHRRALAARGWEVTLCADPALRFDLDTPQDLALVAAR